MGASRVADVSESRRRGGPYHQCCADARHVATSGEHRKTVAQVACGRPDLQSGVHARVCLCVCASMCAQCVCAPACAPASMTPCVRCACVRHECAGACLCCTSVTSQMMTRPAGPSANRRSRRQSCTNDSAHRYTRTCKRESRHHQHIRRLHPCCAHRSECLHFAVCKTMGHIKTYPYAVSPNE